MMNEKFDKFILGKDKRCTISTNCYETQLNNNIMVIGGSGSGKTSGVMNPILLHLHHSNAVVVHTKMGIMQDAAELLKKRGYTVDVINFVNPEEGTAGYDPLLSCSSEADVNCLVHAVVEASVKNDRDPYWENISEELIGVVMRYAWKHCRSMKNAMEMLRQIKQYSKGYWKSYFGNILGNSWDDLDSDQLNKLREDHPLEWEMYKLKEENPKDYETWAGFRDMEAENTRSCIVSTIKTALDGIFTDDAEKVMNRNDWYDVKNMLQEKRVLFIYVSPVNIAMHRLVNIFYGQLFKKLFELAESRSDRMLPYPVHVLCDDFATGCRIADFPELISVFREKRISAVMLIQSESQLRQIYGVDGATTIINNCDTLIFMGGMDLRTCENISLRVNTPRADVMYMPIGVEYFIRRGQKPIKTERYNFLHDEVYLEILEAGKSEAERAG